MVSSELYRPDPTVTTVAFLLGSRVMPRTPGAAWSGLPDSVTEPALSDGLTISAVVLAGTVVERVHVHRAEGAVGLDRVPALPDGGGALADLVAPRGIVLFGQQSVVRHFYGVV